MPVDVPLSEAQLASLRGTRFGEVVQLAETSSTSSLLAARAREGAPQGWVVVADYQTAGRGRFDRRWESPRGASLLFSVLMRPPADELPPARHHLALAALSLAMADAAGDIAGVELRLKWPNDLISVGLIGQSSEHKVAGVLAEVVEGPAPAIVAGMGVNVHWAPDLGGEVMPATSLDAIAGRSVDRGALLARCLFVLDRLYGDWALVASRYRQRCATLGRQVTVEMAGRPPFSGTAVDLDPQGHLVVRGPNAQLVTVAAGDVLHARLSGGPGGVTSSA